MKNLIYSLLALLFLLSACEEPNELNFVVTQDEDGISFLTSPADVYLLADDFAENTAERFIWESADFGSPVNITYEFQLALNSSFDSAKILGTTTETNFALSIGDLLDLATELGLDNDPNTTDSLGNPNNAGAAYARVRAYVGAGSSLDTLSEVLRLDMMIVEQALDGSCDSFFGLGDALVDAGWNWGPHIVLSCEQNVRTGKMKLNSGTFRFFSTENDWGSGLNYPYFEGEGYTISALLEDAQDGDNNFSFVGEDGIYTVVIDENEKTLSVEESGSLWLVGAATPGGWDWGGATEATQTEVDVWEVTVELSNEAFRFFTIKDDWGSGQNYPHYEEAEFTIDDNFEDADDGDNNFRFIGTPGSYKLIVNAREKTISLE